jgi:hypothetical protein
MRLRPEQASILNELFNADIGRVIRERSVAKTTGSGPLTAYNQRLATIRAMTEELARLVEEMGWPREAAVDLRIMVGDIDVTDHARFVVEA